MDQVSLAYFWAAVIAGSILIYVVLDGFDLGVGPVRLDEDEDHRRQMMNVIAPFWDGNETWLVLIGAALFGGFPQVYAIFLPAFYLRVLLLLLALIFRGVAFDSATARPGCGRCGTGGSLWARPSWPSFRAPRSGP